MDGRPPKLRRLPPAAVAGVRAGVGVTNLRQASIELVSNAIDADASQVTVQLDVAHGGLLVADDGHGIAPDSMELLGSRYCTSKSTHDGRLGYRGEALASLAEVSTNLVIRSRAAGTFETWMQR
jgi:DNA mismatch repair ATPase MutL